MRRARLIRSRSATMSGTGEGGAPTATLPRASGEEGTEAAVTPSEVVLLRASDLLVAESSDFLHGTTSLFRGQDRLGSVPRGVATHLFEGQAEFASDAWALAMLTTAFLALEQQGQCHFENREKPKWAGFSKREALFAVPTGDTRHIPWPVPCLERRLGALPEARAIGDIVVDWFGARSEDPGRSALEKAREDLVARGLVDEDRQTRWVLIVTRHYTVAPETEELLPHASETIGLIEECSRERPGIWSALNLEVKQALEDRVDHSDDFEPWTD